MQDCRFSCYTCKKKLSPAISTNKKCQSHHRFLASKCEWGLPKLWCSGCCHPPWWLLRTWGMQEARWTRKQDWAQATEVLVKGMNSVSPEACHAYNAKFLSLIPDFWCSDCLLPLFQIVYSLTSPPASLEQFFQSYWDANSQAQSPKHSHQVK